MGCCSDGEGWRAVVCVASDWGGSVLIGCSEGEGLGVVLGSASEFVGSVLVVGCW